MQRILDQTPGIVNDHPGTSVNNSSPGNIVFPSIRGGLGFETASLIDGHPVAVQDFGDYVTSFLSTDVLQNIEIDKGPGAMPSSINYAINGTFNYVTLNPTANPTGQIKLGYDSDGGTNGNIRYSNTFAKKLGILLDYAQYGTPGPLYNAQNNVMLPTTACSTAPTAGAATCMTQNTIDGLHDQRPQRRIHHPQNAASIAPRAWWGAASRSTRTTTTEPSSRSCVSTSRLRRLRR